MSFLTRALKGWVMQQLGPTLDAFVHKECLDGDSIVITPTSITLQHILSWTELFSAPLRVNLDGLYVLATLKTHMTPDEKLRAELGALDATVKALQAQLPAAQTQAGSAQPSTGSRAQAADETGAAEGAEAPVQRKAAMSPFMQRLITRALDAAQVSITDVHVRLESVQWDTQPLSGADPDSGGAGATVQALALQQGTPSATDPERSEVPHPLYAVGLQLGALSLVSLDHSMNPSESVRGAGGLLGHESGFIRKRANLTKLGVYVDSHSRLSAARVLAEVRAGLAPHEAYSAALTHGDSAPPPMSLPGGVSPPRHSFDANGLATALALPPSMRSAGGLMAALGSGMASATLHDVLDSAHAGHAANLAQMARERHQGALTYYAEECAARDGVRFDGFVEEAGSSGATPAVSNPVKRLLVLDFIGERQFVLQPLSAEVNVVVNDTGVPPVSELQRLMQQQLPDNWAEDISVHLPTSLPAEAIAWARELAEDGAESEAEATLTAQFQEFVDDPLGFCCSLWVQRAGSGTPLCAHRASAPALSGMVDAQPAVASGADEDGSLEAEVRQNEREMLRLLGFKDRVSTENLQAVKVAEVAGSADDRFAVECPVQHWLTEVAQVATDDLLDLAAQFEQHATTHPPAIDASVHVSALHVDIHQHQYHDILHAVEWLSSGHPPVCVGGVAGSEAGLRASLKLPAADIMQTLAARPADSAALADASRDSPFSRAVAAVQHCSSARAVAWHKKCFSEALSGPAAAVQELCWKQVRSASAALATPDGRALVRFVLMQYWQTLSWLVATGRLHPAHACLDVVAGAAGADSSSESHPGLGLAVLYQAEHDAQQASEASEDRTQASWFDLSSWWGGTEAPTGPEPATAADTSTEAWQQLQSAVWSGADPADLSIGSAAGRVSALSALLGGPGTGDADVDDDATSVTSTATDSSALLADSILQGHVPDIDESDPSQRSLLARVLAARRVEAALSSAGHALLYTTFRSDGRAVLGGRLFEFGHTLQLGVRVDDLRLALHSRDVLAHGALPPVPGAACKIDMRQATLQPGASADNRLAHAVKRFVGVPSAQPTTLRFHSASGTPIALSDVSHCLSTLSWLVSATVTDLSADVGMWAPSLVAAHPATRALAAKVLRAQARLLEHRDGARQDHKARPPRAHLQYLRPAGPMKVSASVGGLEVHDGVSRPQQPPAGMRPGRGPRLFPIIRAGKTPGHLFSSIAASFMGEQAGGMLDTRSAAMRAGTKAPLLQADVTLGRSNLMDIAARLSSLDLQVSVAALQPLLAFLAPRVEVTDGPPTVVGGPSLLHPTSSAGSAAALAFADASSQAAAAAAAFSDPAAYSARVAAVGVPRSGMLGLRLQAHLEPLRVTVPLEPAALYGPMLVLSLGRIRASNRVLDRAEACRAGGSGEASAGAGVGVAPLYETVRAQLEGLSMYMVDGSALAPVFLRDANALNMLPAGGDAGLSSSSLSRAPLRSWRGESSYILAPVALQAQWMTCLTPPAEDLPVNRLHCEVTTLRLALTSAKFSILMRIVNSITAALEGLSPSDGQRDASVQSTDESTPASPPSTVLQQFLRAKVRLHGIHATLAVSHPTAASLGPDPLGIGLFEDGADTSSSSSSESFSAVGRDSVRKVLRARQDAAMRTVQRAVLRHSTGRPAQAPAATLQVSEEAYTTHQTSWSYLLDQESPVELSTPFIHRGMHYWNGVVFSAMVGRLARPLLHAEIGCIAADYASHSKGAEIGVVLDSLVVEDLWRVRSAGWDTFVTAAAVAKALGASPLPPPPPHPLEFCTLMQFHPAADGTPLVAAGCGASPSFSRSSRSRPADSSLPPLAPAICVRVDMGVPHAPADMSIDVAMQPLALVVNRDTLAELCEFVGMERVGKQPAKPYAGDPPAAQAPVPAEAPLPLLDVESATKSKPSMTVSAHLPSLSLVLNQEAVPCAAPVGTYGSQMLQAFALSGLLGPNGVQLLPKRAKVAKELLASLPRGRRSHKAEADSNSDGFGISPWLCTVADVLSRPDTAPSQSMWARRRFSAHLTAGSHFVTYGYGSCHPYGYMYKGPLQRIAIEDLDALVSSSTIKAVAQDGCEHDDPQMAISAYIRRVYVHDLSCSMGCGEDLARLASAVCSPNPAASAMHVGDVLAHRHLSHALHTERRHVVFLDAWDPCSEQSAVRPHRTPTETCSSLGFNPMAAEMHAFPGMGALPAITTYAARQLAALASPVVANCKQTAALLHGLSPSTSMVLPWLHASHTCSESDSETGLVDFSQPLTAPFKKWAWCDHSPAGSSPQQSAPSQQPVLRVRGVLPQHWLNVHASLAPDRFLSGHTPASLDAARSHSMLVADIVMSPRLPMGMEVAADIRRPRIAFLMRVLFELLGHVFEGPLAPFLGPDPNAAPYVPRPCAAHVANAGVPLLRARISQVWLGVPLHSSSAQGLVARVEHLVAQSCAPPLVRQAGLARTYAAASAGKHTIMTADMLSCMPGHFAAIEHAGHRAIAPLPAVGGSLLPHVGFLAAGASALCGPHEQNGVIGVPMAPDLAPAGAVLHAACGLHASIVGLRVGTCTLPVSSRATTKARLQAAASEGMVREVNRSAAVWSVDSARCALAPPELVLDDMLALPQLDCSVDLPPLLAGFALPTQGLPGSRATDPLSGPPMEVNIVLSPLCLSLSQMHYMLCLNIASLNISEVATPIPAPFLPVGTQGPPPVVPSPYPAWGPVGHLSMLITVRLEKVRATMLDGDVGFDPGEVLDEVTAGCGAAAAARLCCPTPAHPEHGTLSTCSATALVTSEEPSQHLWNVDLGPIPTKRDMASSPRAATIATFTLSDLRVGVTFGCAWDMTVVVKVREIAADDRRDFSDSHVHPHLARLLFMRSESSATAQTQGAATGDDSARSAAEKVSAYWQTLLGRSMSPAPLEFALYMGPHVDESGRPCMPDVNRWGYVPDTPGAAKPGSEPYANVMTMETSVSDAAIVLSPVLWEILSWLDVPGTYYTGGRPSPQPLGSAAHIFVKGENGDVSSAEAGAVASILRAARAQDGHGVADACSAGPLSTLLPEGTAWLRAQVAVAEHAAARLHDNQNTALDNTLHHVLESSLLGRPPSSLPGLPRPLQQAVAGDCDMTIKASIARPAVFLPGDLKNPLADALALTVDINAWIDMPANGEMGLVAELSGLRGMRASMTSPAAQHLYARALRKIHRAVPGLTSKQTSPSHSPTASIRVGPSSGAFGPKLVSAGVSGEGVLAWYMSETGRPAHLSIGAVDTSDYMKPFSLSALYKAQYAHALSGGASLASRTEVRVSSLHALRLRLGFQDLNLVNAAIASMGLSGDPADDILVLGREARFGPVQEARTDEPRKEAYSPIHMCVPGAYRGHPRPDTLAAGGRPHSAEEAALQRRATGGSVYLFVDQESMFGRELAVQVQGEKPDAALVPGSIATHRRLHVLRRKYRHPSTRAVLTLRTLSSDVLAQWLCLEQNVSGTPGTLSGTNVQAPPHRLSWGITGWHTAHIGREVDGTAGASWKYANDTAQTTAAGKDIDSAVSDPQQLSLVAAVLLPSVSVTVVNDLAGRDMPLLQLEVSKLRASALGFHFRQRMLAEAGLKVTADFYNPESAVWEPLLEPWKLHIEYAAPQPLTLTPAVSQRAATAAAARLARGHPHAGITANTVMLGAKADERVLKSAQLPLAPAWPGRSQQRPPLRLVCGSALFALEDAILDTPSKRALASQPPREPVDQGSLRALSGSHQAQWMRDLETLLDPTTVEDETLLGADADSDDEAYGATATSGGSSITRESGAACMPGRFTTPADEERKRMEALRQQHLQRKASMGPKLKGSSAPWGTGAAPGDGWWLTSYSGVLPKDIPADSHVRVYAAKPLNINISTALINNVFESLGALDRKEGQVPQVLLDASGAPIAWVPADSQTPKPLPHLASAPPRQRTIAMSSSATAIPWDRIPPAKLPLSLQQAGGYLYVRNDTEVSVMYTHVSEDGGLLHRGSSFLAGQVRDLGGAAVAQVVPRVARDPAVQGALQAATAHLHPSTARAIMANSDDFVSLLLPGLRGRPGSSSEKAHGALRRLRRAVQVTAAFGASSKAQVPTQDMSARPSAAGHDDLLRRFKGASSLNSHVSEAPSRASSTSSSDTPAASRRASTLGAVWDFTASGIGYQVREAHEVALAERRDVASALERVGDAGHVPSAEHSDGRSLSQLGWKAGFGQQVDYTLPRCAPFPAFAAGSVHRASAPAPDVDEAAVLGIVSSEGAALEVMGVPSWNGAHLHASSVRGDVLSAALPPAVPHLPRTLYGDEWRGVSIAGALFKYSWRKDKWRKQHAALFGSKFVVFGTKQPRPQPKPAQLPRGDVPFWARKLAPRILSLDREEVFVTADCMDPLLRSPGPFSLEVRRTKLRSVADMLRAQEFLLQHRGLMGCGPDCSDEQALGLATSITQSTELSLSFASFSEFALWWRALLPFTLLHKVASGAHAHEIAPAFRKVQSIATLGSASHAAAIAAQFSSKWTAPSVALSGAMSHQTLRSAVVSGLVMRQGMLAIGHAAASQVVSKLILRPHEEHRSSLRGIVLGVIGSLARGPQAQHSWQLGGVEEGHASPALTQPSRRPTPSTASTPRKLWGRIVDAGGAAAGEASPGPPHEAAPPSLPALPPPHDDKFAGDEESGFQVAPHSSRRTLVRSAASSHGQTGMAMTDAVRPHLWLDILDEALDLTKLHLPVDIVGVHYLPLRNPFAYPVVSQRARPLSGAGGGLSRDGSRSVAERKFDEDIAGQAPHAESAAGGPQGIDHAILPGQGVVANVSFLEGVKTLHVRSTVHFENMTAVPMLLQFETRGTLHTVEGGASSGSGSQTLHHIRGRIIERSVLTPGSTRRSSTRTVRIRLTSKQLRL